MGERRPSRFKKGDKNVGPNKYEITDVEWSAMGEYRYSVKGGKRRISEEELLTTRKETKDGKAAENIEESAAHAKSQASLLETPLR